MSQILLVVDPASAEPEAAEPAESAWAGLRARGHGLWIARPQALRGGVRARALAAPDLVVHFESAGVAASCRSQTWLWEAPIVIGWSRADFRRAADPADARLAPLRSALAAARAVCCSSAAGGRWLEAVWGIAAERIAVLPPAAESTPLARARPRANGRLELCAIGPLEWDQGDEYALCGLRHALDRGVDVSCTRVGDGSERARVVYAVADLALTDRVAIAPAREGRARLGQADALLVPALSPHIPAALVLAMASGIPLIATEAAAGEIVRDGIDGLLVPARDDRALAAALTRMADPALRERLGRAAQQRALERFGAAQRLDALEELYRRAGRTRAPA